MSRDNDSTFAVEQAKAVHWQDLAEEAKQIRWCLTPKAKPEDLPENTVMGVPLIKYLPVRISESFLARNLWLHLKVEFPELPWDELQGANVPREILAALQLVAARRTFRGTCEICAEWEEKEDAPVPTTIETQDAVRQFLASRTGGIESSSITSYRHTLNAFAKHCVVLPTTPEELQSYFAHYKERRSAASAYSPIKQLYEFASERLGLPNPMKTVKRARYKEKEPYSFTLDEARAVVNACRNDWELGLIHLYLGHGFRLDEACRANVGDVLDGQIMVRGKERTEYMPLLPETRDILLRLADGRRPQEAIFTSHRGRRLCHKETYNVVKAILRRAGVTEGKDGQRIATHTLRKTFATLATHAGCNDRVVKKLLRHKTADVTSLYISMPMDALRDNLERYSPIRLLNGQSKEELHKILSCST